MTHARIALTHPHATQLYAAYWAAVVDVAARRLGNIEEAEAVAQEALLRAFDTALREDIQNFRALAMRIALNLAVDIQRRRDWRAPREDPDELLDTAESVEDLPLLVRIRELIDLLEPDQRKLIELKYVEGRSFAQIAEQLGMSKNGVFARHERALDALRAHLSPPGPSAGPRKRSG